MSSFSAWKLFLDRVTGVWLFVQDFLGFRSLVKATVSGLELLPGVWKSWTNGRSAWTYWMQVLRCCVATQGLPMGTLNWNENPSAFEGKDWTLQIIIFRVLGVFVCVLLARKWSLLFILEKVQ